MNLSFLLAWTPFDPWHLLVIMVVALLLFGKRLPEVGRSLGRGISEFKKGLKDVQEEMNKPDADRDRDRLQPPNDSRDPAARDAEGTRTKDHAESR